MSIRSLHKIVSLVLALTLLVQLAFVPLNAAAKDTSREVKDPSRELVESSAIVRGRSIQRLQDIRGFAYRLRQIYRYDWSADINSRAFGENETDAANDENTLHINAVVEIAAAQQLNSNAFVLQAAVTNAQMTSLDDEGNETPATSPEFEADLAKPFYVIQQADGTISQVIFDSTESADTVNLKRGIVSALQARLTSAETSQDAEIDVAGSYLAAYERRIENGQVVLVKQRTEASYRQLADTTAAEYGHSIRQESQVIFDQGLGVVVAVDTDETFTSIQDNVDTAYTGEGDAAWSQANAAGSLRLRPLTSEPLTRPLPSIDPASELDGVLVAIRRTHRNPYTPGSLMADNTVEHRERDVAGEFPVAELETALKLLAANPEDVGVVTQVRATLRTSNEALEMLTKKLLSGEIGAGLYGPVAAALSGINTEAAEAVLIDAIIFNSLVPEEERDQALIALMAHTAPSGYAIKRLYELRQDQNTHLADQALMVLGGIVYTMRGYDLETAVSVVEQLQLELQASTTEEAIEQLLNALGNAGDPSSLPLIETYLEHESPFVRLAALEALRKLEGAKVDMLISERAISETNPAVQSAAEQLLADRNQSAMGKMDAKPLWSWEKWVGGKDVKGHLYARIESSMPSDQLKVDAYAGVDGHAWKHKKTLIKAQVLSDVVKKDNVLKRRFGAYLYVLGNKVASKEAYLDCGKSEGGTLKKYSLTFLSFSVSYFPWGIHVKLGITIKGNLAVNYSYAFDACTPTNTQASASIIPAAWVSLEAEASISLYVVRVGVGVSADVMRTELPGTITGKLNPSLKGCAKLEVNMTPISGQLYLWGQRWKILKGKWSDKSKWVLWSFSSKTYKTTLLNECR